MRKTEHYNLNLVEGSDIVNPLVQDVPNYEAIDEALFENANTGIPVATELISGTVHAITRQNPNAAMFRFIATKSYKSGDTFTVDGVQVSALLPNGEPLANDSYVANANVLCCLVGTMLTVFAVKMGDTTAQNSLALDGHSADYFGTAEGVAEAIDIAQSANTVALANQQNIANVSSKANTNANNISTINSKLGGLSFTVMTQSAYDALATKNNNTVYFIRG